MPPKIFESKEELAHYIKERSPKVTLPDEQVADLALAKWPDKVQIRTPSPGPEMIDMAPEGLQRMVSVAQGAGRGVQGVNQAAGRGMQAAGKGIERLVNAVPGADQAGMGLARLGQAAEQAVPPSPVDLAQSVTQRGGMLDVAGQGMASGMSFGGTEQLSKALGQEPPTGSAIYQGAKLAGELTLPYQAMMRVVGKVPIAARALGAGAQAGRFGAAHPAVTRVLQAGAEGGGVEFVKAGMRGENPMSNGAMAFAGDMVVETALRGGGRLGQKGVEHWVKAREFERAGMQKVRAQMQKWGIEDNIPTILRPNANAPNFFFWRSTKSASTREIYRKTARRLAKGVKKATRSAMAEIGEGAPFRAPSEVGGAILRGFKREADMLKKESSDIYEALMSDSAIREMKVDPTEVFTRQYPVTRINDEAEYVTETVTQTGSMLDQLEGVLSGAGVDIVDPSPRMPQALKSILSLYKDIRKKGVVPKEHIPGGRSTGKHQAELKSYMWYWNEVKQLGHLLDSSEVKDSPGVKRAVTAAYHVVQDGMDQKVASSVGTYGQMIEQARALRQAWQSYTEHPLLVAARKIGEGTQEAVGKPEDVLGGLFDSKSGVAAAKTLMTPELFDHARQAWLTDLLLRHLDKTVKGEITAIHARSLAKEIQKLGDIDGEFFKELFSDQGFVDATGEAVQAQTGAAGKGQVFGDFAELIETISPVLGDMKSATGRVDFSDEGMVERLGGGALAQAAGSVSASVGMVKALLANLLMARKSADMFLAPYEQNIFLGGGSLEPLETIGFGKGARGDMLRRHTTSALVNRLTGASREQQ